MTKSICPTCNGKGRIRNPKSEMIYDNYMTCPNCQGEGFIGIPDNLPIKKPLYYCKLYEVKT